MNRSRSETWIKTGYKILATEGKEGIKAERLSRLLHLNKSGFYHYFGNMKMYLKYLLQYHIRMAEAMAEEIADCQRIDPDFLLVIVKHKTFILVESQLQVKYKAKPFGEDTEEAGRIVCEKLLPLWGKATALPECPDVARAYLNIMRNFFYTQVHSGNMNYEFLHTLVFETNVVMNKVVEMQRVSLESAERLHRSE